MRTPQKVKNKKKGMTNDQKVVAISRRIVKACKFPPDEEMNDEIKQQQIKSTNNKIKTLALRREFWLDNIHLFNDWIYAQPMSTVSRYNVKPQKHFCVKICWGSCEISTRPGNE